MSEDARISTPAASNEGPEYASSSPIPVPRAERLAARTVGARKKDVDPRQQVVMERRGFGSPSRLVRMFTRKKAEDEQEAAAAEADAPNAADGGEQPADGDAKPEEIQDNDDDGDDGQAAEGEGAPAEAADAAEMAGGTVTRTATASSSLHAFRKKITKKMFGPVWKPANAGQGQPEPPAAQGQEAPAEAAEEGGNNDMATQDAKPAPAAPSPSRWRFGFGRAQKAPAAGQDGGGAAPGDRQQEARASSSEAPPAPAVTESPQASSSLHAFRKKITKKMFGPVWKPPPAGQGQPEPPGNEPDHLPEEQAHPGGEEGEEGEHADEDTKPVPPKARSRAAPRPQGSPARAAGAPPITGSLSAQDGAEQPENGEGGGAKLDEKFPDEGRHEEASGMRGFFRNVFSRKPSAPKDGKGTAEAAKSGPSTPTSPGESPPGARQQAGFPDESPPPAVESRASPSRSLFRNVFLRKSRGNEEATAAAAAASPPDAPTKGRPSPGGKAAAAPVDDVGDAPATPISGAMREQERARKLRSSAQKQGGLGQAGAAEGEAATGGPAYAQVSRSGRTRKSPQAKEEGDHSGTSARVFARDVARGPRGDRKGGSPPQGDGTAAEGEEAPPRRGGGDEADERAQQPQRTRRRARDMPQEVEGEEGGDGRPHRPRSAGRDAAAGSGDGGVVMVAPTRRARGRARDVEAREPAEATPQEPDASAGHRGDEGLAHGRRPGPRRTVNEEDSAPPVVEARRRVQEVVERPGREDLPDVEGDTLATRSKRAEETGLEPASQRGKVKRKEHRRADKEEGPAQGGRGADDAAHGDRGEWPEVADREQPLPSTRRRQGRRGDGEGSAQAGEAAGDAGEGSVRRREGEGSGRGRREQEEVTKGSAQGDPSASTPAVAAPSLRDSEAAPPPSTPSGQQRASIMQLERAKSLQRRDQRHLKVKGPRAGTPGGGAVTSGDDDAPGAGEGASSLAAVVESSMPEAPVLSPATQEREDAARRERAAILIQAHIRGYNVRKAHPLVRRQLRLEMEARDWAARWDAELLRKAAGGGAPQGDVCQLVVHRTDVLQPDLAMTQPLVRVHFVDAASGRYWEKGDKARAAVQAGETVSYILPAQTKPFDLRARVKKVFAAEWDEPVLVDQDVRQLMERAATQGATEASAAPTGAAGASARPPSELLLLFELLQLPQTFSSFQRRKVPANRLNPDGSYRVAWAFLKPKLPLRTAGSNPARLQMYSYATGRQVPKPPMPAGGAASALNPAGSPSSPDVYYQWLHLQSQRQLHRTPTGETLLPPALLYPSSLYISMLAVPRPAPSVVVASARPGGTRGAALPMQVERGRLPVGQLLKAYKRVHLVGAKALQEIQEPAPGDEEGADKEESVVVKRPVRAPNEPCIIPNALETCIKTGIKSCVAVRFSNHGSYLAAACNDGLLFPVRIFTITGTLKVVFKGHHELVYDLAWDENDEALLSASSDFTAKLWDVSEAEVGVQGAQVTFQHPCFVYCAAFHPTATGPKIIVTGGYDKNIRLWNRESGELIRSICLHRSYVNSIAFDLAGKRMYSGDGEGVIKECASDQRAHPGMLKLLRSSNELAGSPVSCLRMGPSGTKLAVLCRRNRAAVLDLKVFGVGRSTSAFKCAEHPLKCEWSPDGRYVLAGSEDGRVLLWDLEANSVHHLGHMLWQPGVKVYDASWNKREHSLALASTSHLAPLLVYSYDDSLPSVKLSQPVASLAPPPSLALAPAEKPLLLGAPYKAVAVAVRKEDRSKPHVPPRLTPEKVAEMLASLRAQSSYAATRFKAYNHPAFKDRLYAGALKTLSRIAKDSNYDPDRREHGFGFNDAMSMPDTPNMDSWGGEDSSGVLRERNGADGPGRGQGGADATTKPTQRLRSRYLPGGDRYVQSPPGDGKESMQGRPAYVEPISDDDEVGDVPRTAAM